MIQAADDILTTVADTGVSYLDAKLLPDAFRQFEGRGVVFGDVDEDDDEGGEPVEVQRVQVDVAQVLSEALADRGLSVVECDNNDFFILAGAEAHSVRFLFAANNQVPLYARQGEPAAPTSIVIHVRSDIDDEALPALHAMGVHPIRLRDLATIDPAELLGTVRTVGVAREQARLQAGGELLDTTTGKKLIDLAHRADPGLVEHYASTAAANLFEAATARIVAPLVRLALPFGSAFTGKPVPDGLLIGKVDEKSEVVTYDCKSKQDDEYGLSPPDGDQQSRYLAIQDRLDREDGWRSRGVVLFTPQVPREKFESQIQKDYWRQIARHGRRLVVVPASVLARWYELQRAEMPGALGLFDPGCFWRALLDGELPGTADAHATKILPDRADCRLVTVAAAEVYWLAGFDAPLSPQHQAIKASLGQIDLKDRRTGRAAVRPSFLRTYYEALGRRMPRLIRSRRRPASKGAACATCSPPPTSSRHRAPSSESWVFPTRIVCGPPLV